MAEQYLEIDVNEILGDSKSSKVEQINLFDAMQGAGLSGSNEEKSEDIDNSFSYIQMSYTQKLWIG